jgi:hypothetical protein
MIEHGDPLVAALAAANVAALALWIATRRLGLVIATRRRAAGETAAAPDRDPVVEERLVEDIRRWRAQTAGSAAPPAVDLDPWIAEVERSERGAGSGTALPPARRKRAVRGGTIARNARAGSAHGWHGV